MRILVAVAAVALSVTPAFAGKGTSSVNDATNSVSPTAGGGGGDGGAPNFGSGSAGSAFQQMHGGGSTGGGGLGGGGGGGGAAPISAGQSATQPGVGTVTATGEVVNGVAVTVDSNGNTLRTDTNGDGIADAP